MVQRKFITLIIVALCAPTLLLLISNNANAGWDVGNGGDELKLVFEKGRTNAADMLRTFSLDSPPSTVDIKIIDFLKQPKGNSTVKDAMITDIYTTPYLWIPGDGSNNTPVQQICALTNIPGLETTIRLSLEACDRNLRLPGGAEKFAAALILHETVHHFGLDDSPVNDAFASQLALAIVASQQTPSNKVEINPNAFNAVELWRTGEGTEALSLPEWWHAYSSSQSNSSDPDGVFSVPEKEFWKNFYSGPFVGVPTEGVEVKGSALVYPPRNNRHLKLFFSPRSRFEMGHFHSIKHCQEKKMRLPTARELFDFCAAGITELNYGPDFPTMRYPASGRCAAASLWSVTQESRSDFYAWSFSVQNSTLTTIPRNQELGVRCVGEVQ